MFRILWVSIIVFSLSAFISSCCQRLPDQKGGGPSPAVENLDMDDGIELERFTGYIVVGPRAGRFKNSPDGEYYMAKDETGTLREIYRSLTFMEEEPIYLDCEAEKLEMAGEDLPADAPKILVIRNVIETKTVSRDDPIFDFEFFCFGNEPFWAVDIIKDDELILRDIGKSQVTYFTYSPPTIDGDVTRYECELSHGASVGNLIVTITRQDCSDSMSGYAYEYTSVVEIGEVTFEGCAEKPESLSSLP